MNMGDKYLLGKMFEKKRYWKTLSLDWGSYRYVLFIVVGDYQQFCNLGHEDTYSLCLCKKLLFLLPHPKGCG